MLFLAIFLILSCFSTEYIFAAAFGVALVHERLTWRTIVGGICMMAGLYLVILFDESKQSKAAIKHEKIAQ